MTLISNWIESATLTVENHIYFLSHYLLGWHSKIYERPLNLY